MRQRHGGAGMSSLEASQTNVETPNPGEDALLSGQVSPEPEGARIDFYLEGPVIGPKLTGTVKGVDYLYFRADGRA